MARLKAGYAEAISHALLHGEYQIVSVDIGDALCHSGGLGFEQKKSARVKLLFPGEFFEPIKYEMVLTLCDIDDYPLMEK